MEHAKRSSWIADEPEEAAPDWLRGRERRGRRRRGAAAAAGIGVVAAGVLAAGVLVQLDAAPAIAVCAEQTDCVDAAPTAPSSVAVLPLQGARADQVTIRNDRADDGTDIGVVAWVTGDGVVRVRAGSTDLAVASVPAGQQRRITLSGAPSGAVAVVLQLGGDAAATPAPSALATGSSATGSTATIASTTSPSHPLSTPMASASSAPAATAPAATGPATTSPASTDPSTPSAAPSAGAVISSHATGHPLAHPVDTDPAGPSSPSAAPSDSAAPTASAAPAADATASPTAADPSPSTAAPSPSSATAGAARSTRSTGAASTASAACVSAQVRFSPHHGAVSQQQLSDALGRYATASASAIPTSSAAIATIAAGTDDAYVAAGIVPGRRSLRVHWRLDAGDQSVDAVRLVHGGVSVSRPARDGSFRIRGLEAGEAVTVTVAPVVDGVAGTPVRLTATPLG